MATLRQNKSPKQKWDITANRFVGYIDIMGFKDMVARNSHERVYKMMQHVSEAMKATESVYSVDYDSEGFEINIRMMTYSDSIMIYSRDDGESSLDNFIGAISSLTEDLFLAEIPHKGAVACGMMTLDFRNSIFFGQPLIDAYLLQEELNFYGIVVHATAEFKRGFKEDESVFAYPCPFKNGVGKHYTITPGTFLTGPFDETEYSKLVRKVTRLGIKTSGALRKYIDNTVSYLSSSRKDLIKRIEEYEKENG